MSVSTSAVIRAAWQLIAEQYTAGVTVSDLARRHRFPRATMVDRLRRMGVYEEGRRQGPPPVDRCKRDHDLAEHGRDQYKRMPDGSRVKNGRQCMKCKRDRRTATATERTP